MKHLPAAVAVVAVLLIGYVMMFWSLWASIEIPELQVVTWHEAPMVTNSSAGLTLTTSSTSAAIGYISSTDIATGGSIATGLLSSGTTDALSVGDIWLSVPVISTRPIR